MSLNRIGKSLIKFLKPVRVAPPHVVGKRQVLPPAFEKQRQQEQEEELKKGFKLLQLNRSSKEKSEDQKALARMGVDPLVPETEQEQIAPLEKAPAHWLDLVLYLVNACRKVSGKMKRRIGIDTYRRSALERGKDKLNAVGSIVDTTPIAVDLDAKKIKEAA